MKPVPLDDVAVAFPASVKELMPPMDEIPEEFTQFPGTPQNKFVSQWFFGGASKKGITPKPGIDENAAWRHLKAIMGSWEPKHEHKEAAVAYLLSQWFDMPGLVPPADPHG